MRLIPGREAGTLRLQGQQSEFAGLGLGLVFGTESDTAVELAEYTGFGRYDRRSRDFETIFIQFLKILEYFIRLYKIFVFLWEFID
jgi:hypothetical protein